MPTPISVPKGYQRLGDFPLDATSVFDTYAALQAYSAPGGTAYPGQICAVKATGLVYVIQSDYSLAQVGAGSGTTDASLLTSGILPDARLSTNITRRGGDTVVSDAAPATPFTGLRWVNSNTGRAFDWVDNFWVETGAGGGGGGNASVQYVTELPANPLGTTLYVVTPVGGTSTIYLGNISLGGGTGGGGGNTFRPLLITGLQLWLDADDPATLFDSTSGGSAVAENGSVARWEDKSGKGLQASQPISNNAPIVKSNLLNGKSGIYFDGINDTLDLLGLNLPQPFTIFSVFRTRSYGTRFIFDRAGLSGPRFSIGIDGSALFYYANGPTDNYVDLANSSSNINLVTSAYLNGNSSQLYRNGQLVCSGSVGTDAFNTIRFGSRFSYDYQSDINLFEIIAYNRLLTTAERQQVESYLSTKWGIAI